MFFSGSTQSKSASEVNAARNSSSIASLDLKPEEPPAEVVIRRPVDNVLEIPDVASAVATTSDAAVKGSSAATGVDDSITRCICELGHDDGYMICCDQCL